MADIPFGGTLSRVSVAEELFDGIIVCEVDWKVIFINVGIDGVVWRMAQVVDSALLGTACLVDAKGGGLSDKSEGATSWRIFEGSTHSANLAF